MNRVIQYIAGLFLWPFRPKLSASLTAINRARVALGLFPVSELPCGKQGAIDECPVSQLLPGIIGANGVSFDQQEDALRVAAAWNTAVEIGGRGRMIATFPRILSRFVEDFDLGAYPSLVKKGRRRRPMPARAADIQPLKRGRYYRPSDDRRAA